MKDLNGKVAFVTGAASGIGLGIATALADAGVKVMLGDIEAGALKGAVERLQQAGRDADGIVVDVSRKDDLQNAADAVLKRFGKVHMLVNNAGVGGGGDYGKWSDKSWSWTIGVNLMSVVWGMEIFGPLIERQGEGGQIVSTASMAGLVGGARAYNATKAAVVSLSEGLRPVLAPHGIGVSVLCPAFVRTGIMTSGQGRPADEMAPELLKMASARVDTGVDPLYVGELVREAIQNDWPYIFTDTERETAVAARFAAIKQGFDQIRDRKPRY